MTNSGPQPSNPTRAHIEAMISVLADDSVVLHRSARRLLVSWGDSAVPMLTCNANAECMATRTRCRAILREIEIAKLLDRFMGLEFGQIGRGSALGLFDGVMITAQMVSSFVPDARSLAAQLIREANALRHEIAGMSLPRSVKMLTDRLCNGMGLSGCDAGELTINNLLLDRVVANGVGAPITLSITYMMVARWAGLTATGVALPNHFLVRIHGPRSLLIDPFHGGRVIPKADCARYLRACGVHSVRDQLRDLADREVMIHYLRTLWRELPKQQSRCRDHVGHALGHLEGTVS